MQVILNKGAVLRELQAKTSLLHSSKQQAAAELGRIAAEPIKKAESNLNKCVSKTSPVGYDRNMCWMKRHDVIASPCSPASHLLRGLLLAINTKAEVLFQSQFPLFLDGFGGDCPKASTHPD